MIRSSSTLFLHSRPYFKFKPPLTSLGIRLHHHHHHHHPLNFNFKTPQTCCRLAFSDDAPFAAAIGASMLSSLLFPVPVAPEEEEAAVTSTDSRLAVMGIISFIPYFNWLSWIFAWLDTGKRRYAVYSLVYLAPYLRSNLSLSPEESWLPIASIFFCIVHIQLEASIRNGDIQGFRLFRSVMDQQSSSRKKDRFNQEMAEESKNEKKLPPAAEEEISRDIGGWDSQRPLKQEFDDHHHDGEKSKH